MTSNFEEYRKRLIILCEKSLHGDLSVEELFATWPKEISKTGFMQELFDDLEECVEHFPAHVISGKKNFELWSRSHMFYKLNVDVQLLASGLCEGRMFSLRKVILDNDIRDKACIKNLIDEQKSAPG